LRQEGTELLRRIPEGLEVLALTRTGQGLTSRGLAEVLGEMATYGMPGAAFLVGGAYGLSSEVLARADRRFSLSRMTLPHELARLILVEQLYRAGTILRGEPYHKGG
jgi:23S rRNA (pseudouridine1915-N3)-methyltransferase